jgi:DNA-binding response OmpR family regulator
VKILFIEDQERMAQALCEILRQENYDVDHYVNGVDGLEAAKSGIYDIIILDIMLPGMNGYEVAKNIRKNDIKTPILMLTAKADLDDKVMGLDSGADDYLTKPFMTKELLARLRALGRRFSSTADGTLSFGDITLDRGNLTLYCITNKNSVRLSEKEFKILEYLVMNQNQILTKEQIIAKIWGFNNDAEYNNVEVYMTFTRRKLSFIESKTEIKSIRGVGYELRWRDVQEN